MSLGGVASFAITLLSWGQAVARRAASSASDHAEDIGTRGDADGTPTAELMAVAAVLVKESLLITVPYTDASNPQLVDAALQSIEALACAQTVRCTAVRLSSPERDGRRLSKGEHRRLSDAAVKLGVDREWLAAEDTISPMSSLPTALDAAVEGGTEVQVARLSADVSISATEAIEPTRMLDALADTADVQEAISAELHLAPDATFAETPQVDHLVSLSAPPSPPAPRPPELTSCPAPSLLVNDAITTTNPDALVTAGDSGVAAGAVVGAVVGVVAILLFAFIMWRVARNRRGRGRLALRKHVSLKVDMHVDVTSKSSS